MSDSKNDPMPTPYTRIPNDTPVGLYMPGRYFTPEYLAWLARRRPIPYRERHFDADEAIGIRREEGEAA